MPSLFLVCVEFFHVCIPLIAWFPWNLQIQGDPKRLSQVMPYIGIAPKGKIPHTWQFLNIKIPKPPYKSSQKNHRVIALFYFFGSVRKKIQSTVFNDHPVHQILMPDQMFPEHLKDNEGALPSPVCSCVRVKRKCSSLPRALNIKCADKLSFFPSIFSQSKSFHCIQHIFQCSEFSRSHLVKAAKWNKVLHIQPFPSAKLWHRKGWFQLLKMQKPIFR